MLSGYAPLAMAGRYCYNPDIGEFPYIASIPGKNGYTPLVLINVNPFKKLQIAKSR